MVAQRKITNILQVMNYQGERAPGVPNDTGVAEDQRGEAAAGY